MALVGSIEQFNPKESDVSSYLERLEQLFVCNVVEDDKKVAFLLTLIGGEAYNVLKDLLAPELPSTKSYVQLKHALTDHYSPKRLVIAERYKFYNAVQEQNEDLKMFVAKLKKLSQYCNFGQFLSECLRDRFVCGIKSHAIKRKLLSEDNLTFENAYRIGLSMELAEGQTKSMGAESSMMSLTEILDKMSLKNKFIKKDSTNDRSSSQSRVWKPWDHTSEVCRRANVNAVDESEEVQSDGDDSLYFGLLSNLGSSKEEAIEVEAYPESDQESLDLSRGEEETDGDGDIDIELPPLLPFSTSSHCAGGSSPPKSYYIGGGGEHQPEVAKSRKPRRRHTAFTHAQLVYLEQTFRCQKYQSAADRSDVADALNLSETQVNTWYQNRRTKWKRKNQLRLEQFGHQASVAKELLNSAVMRKINADSPPCCPQLELR